MIRSWQKNKKKLLPEKWFSSLRKEKFHCSQQTINLLIKSLFFHYTLRGQQFYSGQLSLTFPRWTFIWAFSQFVQLRCFRLSVNVLTQVCSKDDAATDIWKMRIISRAVTTVQVDSHEDDNSKPFEAVRVREIPTLNIPWSIMDPKRKTLPDQASWKTFQGAHYTTLLLPINLHLRTDNVYNQQWKE